MRLFVAVEMPPPVREALGELQARLRERMAGETRLRWVAPERIHLTLKFLGNVDASLVPALAAALDRAVREQPAFELVVGGLGTFPSARAAKVLWVGLAGDLDALERLRARVEQAMVGAGLPAEKRPFRAHLTLARVPDGVRPHEVGDATAGALADAIPTFSVQRVALVRSTLGPGPSYRTLASAPLAGRG